MSMPERDEQARQGQAELQTALLGSIERMFTTNGLFLDSRVRDAFLSVPRDRHVPSLTPMTDVYLDQTIYLDLDECVEEVTPRVVEHLDVDAELSKDKLSALVNIFVSPRVSTASQPTVVALMTQAVLPPKEEMIGRDLRALDIGTGLGFQAAILQNVGFKVVTIEMKEHLADRARQIFRDNGVSNIDVICGDGKLGYPENAPYDAIIVSAAVRDEQVVETLIGQLREGGRIILPFVTNVTKKPIEIAGYCFEREDSDTELRVYQRTTDGAGHSYVVLTGGTSFVDLQ